MAEWLKRNPWIFGRNLEDNHLHCHLYASALDETAGIPHQTLKTGQLACREWFE